VTRLDSIAFKHAKKRLQNISAPRRPFGGPPGTLRYKRQLVSQLGHNFLASVRLLGKDRYDAELYDAICGPNSKNRDTLEAAIDDSRSYSLDYFAVKTLLSGYLLRVGDRVAERPSHMFMRVSLGIHGTHDLPRVLETYKLLSEAAFTHASPTLFSSGTKRPQLASCLVAGTHVLTTQGTKPIEEVLIGDQVVTHGGRAQRVSQLHQNQLGGGPSEGWS
jgi:hypothetical protein